jgi:hypothetical protein
VNGSGVIEWRNRPASVRLNGVVTDRDGRRNRRGLMNRFVENRAVEPDHVPVSVVEFGALGRLVRFKMVRGEMAVGDRVFVFARLGLVDVRRRQG